MDLHPWGPVSYLTPSSPRHPVPRSEWSAEFLLRPQKFFGYKVGKGKSELSPLDKCFYIDVDSKTEDNFKLFSSS